MPVLKTTKKKAIAGTFHFYNPPPPPPTKDGRFFSNMPMKNKLFRFHFSKSADKSLRVQIPVIPAGVWIENGMSHMSTLTIKVVRPTQQIMAPI